MHHYGLPAISIAEKKALIDRINAGPPYSLEERKEILDYCQSDIDALALLVPAMWSRNSLDQRSWPAQCSRAENSLVARRLHNAGGSRMSSRTWAMVSLPDLLAGILSPIGGRPPL